jgi:hypothetical protein
LVVASSAGIYSRTRSYWLRKADLHCTVCWKINDEYPFGGDQHLTTCRIVGIDSKVGMCSSPTVY